MAWELGGRHDDEEALLSWLPREERQVGFCKSTKGVQGEDIERETNRKNIDAIETWSESVPFRV